jgi:Zn-dependent M28 family amino/carboxypeptidase
VPLLPGLVTPALVMGGLVMFAGVPLWFLDLGDDSPGAIDNASSVGVVMELAQALANNPEVHCKIDLTILLTSAEEASTMGAVAYVQRHAKELRQWDKSNRLYVLNLDGVGVDGSLRWVGMGARSTSHSEPRLLSLVDQACTELGYEIKDFYLPGALYDHLPFAELGLDAGTLVAVSRASLGIHTRKDSADQLNIRGFEQAGQVTLKVIRALLNN